VECQLNYLGTIGTQRHANADFVGSLRHRVGRDAVESNRGQHESDHPEPTREIGYGALLIEGEINLLLHGSDAGDGQDGVHVRQNPTKSSLRAAPSRP
jgi:hypothetical protein